MISSVRPSQKYSSSSALEFLNGRTARVGNTVAGNLSADVRLTVFADVALPGDISGSGVFGC